MNDDRVAESAQLHKAGAEAALAGQFQPARRLLQNALELGGGLHSPAERGRIQRNLAEVNRRLGRTREAVESGQAAVRLLGRDAGALLNLGVALADAGQDDAALACLDEALEVSPALAEAHLARAEIFLRRGDFETGWTEYAWRTKIPAVGALVPDAVLADAGAAEWDGAAGGRSLLVVADQGFGDMIFFARFLPWAASRCWRLTVHAPRAIFGLFAGVPGLAVLTDDWREVTDFSAWCALADLPKLAGAEWREAASKVPYARFAGDAVAAGRAALDALVPPVPGRLRVGLVWAGHALQMHDSVRSIRLSGLEKLAEHTGVDWVSLQKGDAAAQRAAWPGAMADAASGLDDFAATAGVLAGLDLLISVDTSVAHLAGAMGLPVWVLLRERADWRWESEPDGGGRWYPATRAFRQALAGDWHGVVARVSQALSQLQLAPIS
jgi:hypothetical protein